MTERILSGEKCRVQLAGPLQVFSPDGKDITPNAAKACGLIAILVDTDGHRRSRRWLESKLWSDRAPQQASGSLRQALTDIRKTFGPYESLLMSTRQDIWLDKQKILPDFGIDGPVETRELLEGLDVRDQEFEAWLRDFRQRRQPQALPEQAQSPRLSSGIRLYCVASGGKNSIDRIAGQVIADQIGANIEGAASAWRVAEVSNSIGDIEISSDIVREAKTCLIHVKVTHHDSGRVLFSGVRQRRNEFADIMDEDFIAAFAHDAATRSLQKIPLAIDLDVPDVVAIGFSNLAIKRIGRFKTNTLEDADDLMTRAYEVSGNGTYLGWRSFISMAKVVDLQAPAETSLLEEADQLCRQALEQAPDSAQNLALIGLTRMMLFDDIEGGVLLAEAALRADPLNMLARQAHAVTRGAFGQPKEAYALSARCQAAVSQDELRHIWDLYHSLVCISSGRFDEALNAAKSASLRCPDFLAPRRQALALAAMAHDFSTARKHRKELERMDPSFTLDRMLLDDDYPVSTLRRAGALNFSRDDVQD